MRLFLALKKEKVSGKQYIAALIKSKRYPSKYAFENKDASIVELPQIEDGDIEVGKEIVEDCHTFI